MDVLQQLASQLLVADLMFLLFSPLTRVSTNAPANRLARVVTSRVEL